MFRDEQVAEEVRRKAELGWLDVEFTVYGTAYYSENEMHYMVSTDEKDIYCFIEMAALKDIFCSEVISYTEKCSVPIGTKEDKELEVKKKLARKLKGIYPARLFELLTETANILRNDCAKTMLDCLQNETEGIFDERKIRYFEIMVNYCYSSLKISRETFRAYTKWITEERGYMEDDFVQKEQFEKTYYGFVYEDLTKTSGVKYIEDSLLEYVLKKRAELYKKNVLTGAVYEKTIYYNHSKSPVQIRKEFLDELKMIMSADYFKQLKAISTKKTVTKEIADKVNDLNEAARETYYMYLGKWGAICE